MNTNVARINSRLYFDLFTRGGDKLVATFSVLKTSRTEDKYYAYTAKNNKFVGGYALLRAKTNLTLHTIQTYLPSLIDMGVVRIQSNGDVYIMGGDKVSELYNSKKLVPIIIGKNIVSTALSSLSVRSNSAEKQQKIQIEKKQYRSELLKQASKPTDYKTYRKIKRLIKKLGTDKIEIVDTVILSNQGYALLKHGISDNKSMGCYWKNRLVKNGFIKSKRRFTKLHKMTYADYKNYIYCYPNVKAVYKNGFLCKEEIASLKSINLITQSKVEESTVIPTQSVSKGLHRGMSYLSFDMIAFWKNKA